MACGKGMTGGSKIAKCWLLLVSHQHLQICVLSKLSEWFIAIELPHLFLYLLLMLASALREVVWLPVTLPR